jgi:hypothetical protein
VNTGDPADLVFAPWDSDVYAYVGPPEYLVVSQDITGHLVPGRTHVRVGLGIWELGWVWGVEGTDGTPAPYFDNVRVLAYPFLGPAIETMEWRMAQDVFPERGVVDHSNLAEAVTCFQGLEPEVMSPPAFQQLHPAALKNKQ